MKPIALAHAGPAAGFDEPFEMLGACHERVERSLRLLERLGEHLVAHGEDDAARSAARDVLRYFDLAAPAHHEDEERHVLPSLRAHGQGALADRMLADHARLASAWSALRTELESVARGDATGAPATHAGWRDFASLYREHMALEDSRALPMARGWLDADNQRAMGEEMARRRGVGSGWPAGARPPTP